MSNEDLDVVYRQNHDMQLANRVNAYERNYMSSNRRNEPKYDNMTTSNINVTSKGMNLFGKAGIVLTTFAILAGTLFMNDINLNNNRHNVVAQEAPGYYYESPITINQNDCDLSDFTVILREATSNVDEVVLSAEEKLDSYGVDYTTITSNDDLIGTIKEIKMDKPNKEIVVINIDGITNGAEETVILTNYSNEDKSADAIALAVKNTCPRSEIRCGKSNPQNGKRCATSVEAMIQEAGYGTDIACLTVAPSCDRLNDGTIDASGIGTAISESILRYRSLGEEERNVNFIHRVDLGDNISTLADQYGVSEAYIRKSNSEILNSFNGLVVYDQPMIVSPIPQVLTEKNVIIENNLSVHI